MRLSRLWRNGNRNLNNISFFIPEKLKATIDATHICQESTRDDKLIWDLSSNGKFNTGSAYTLIQNSIPSKYIQSTSKRFNWIWKLKWPNKIKTLIWVIHHGRLQTAQHLYRIGNRINQHCNICAYSEEDINHIFFENDKAFWDNVSSNSTSNASNIDSTLSFKNWD